MKIKLVHTQGNQASHKGLHKYSDKQHIVNGEGETASTTTSAKAEYAYRPSDQQISRLGTLEYNRNRTADIQQKAGGRHATESRGQRERTAERVDGRQSRQWTEWAVDRADSGQSGWQTERMADRVDSRHSRWQTQQTADRAGGGQKELTLMIDISLRLMRHDIRYNVLLNVTLRILAIQLCIENGSDYSRSDHHEQGVSEEWYPSLVNNLEQTSNTTPRINPSAWHKADTPGRWKGKRRCTYFEGRCTQGFRVRRSCSQTATEPLDLTARTQVREHGEEHRHQPEETEPGGAQQQDRKASSSAQEEEDADLSCVKTCVLALEH
ncbi:hypothetical protein C8Q74DRAFT_1219651 [Fomes fomentarius]|nr:hypothetical protein C8Q74DRAFT_1219651 [Fomes fomentarius]